MLNLDVSLSVFLTRLQYNVLNVVISLKSLHVLFTKPRTLLVLAVIEFTCEFHDKLELVSRPKSLYIHMYTFQTLIIYVIVPNQRTLFSSDSHDLIFLGIYFHFIILTPIRNLIQVTLKI